MNTTPIRLVIGFVGLTLLGALVGIVVLASQDHSIPDVLQNLAVGALTGLVGLLVPAGRTAGE
jgi:H+/Cl- antiporter ClcA